jgi:hypothetical protein
MLKPAGEVAPPPESWVLFLILTSDKLYDQPVCCMSCDEQSSRPGQWSARWGILIWLLSDDQIAK